MGSTASIRKGRARVRVRTLFKLKTETQEVVSGMFFVASSRKCSIPKVGTLQLGVNVLVLLRVSLAHGLGTLGEENWRVRLGEENSDQDPAGSAENHHEPVVDGLSAPRFK